MRAAHAPGADGALATLRSSESSATRGNNGEASGRRRNVASTKYYEFGERQVSFTAIHTRTSVAGLSKICAPTGGWRGWTCR